jgi:hypothetical protein
MPQSDAGFKTSRSKSLDIPGRVRGFDLSVRRLCQYFFQNAKFTNTDPAADSTLQSELSVSN